MINPFLSFQEELLIALPGRLLLVSPEKNKKSIIDEFFGNFVSMWYTRTQGEQGKRMIHSSLEIALGLRIETHQRGHAVFAREGGFHAALGHASFLRVLTQQVQGDVAQQSTAFRG